jgi:hypothetical protein
LTFYFLQKALYYFLSFFSFLVQCDDDIADSSNQTSYPDSAHDIRVEPFAKAMSRRLAESYQLAVDISWQTPPNNSTKLLKGFRVEIETEDQATHLCFLFNVSESNWTSETVAASVSFLVFRGICRFLKVFSF